jgi:Bacterial PH domain
MKIRIERNPIFLIIFVDALLMYFIPSWPINGTFMISFSLIYTLIFVILAFMYFYSFFILDSENFISIFGFLKTKIMYSEITKVSYSNNLIASQAWTLTRLEITTNDKSYLLSLPKKADKEKFIQEIKRKCPHVDIQIDY